MVVLSSFGVNKYPSKEGYLDSKRIYYLPEVMAVVSFSWISRGTGS